MKHGLQLRYNICGCIHLKETYNLLVYSANINNVYHFIHINITLWISQKLKKNVRNKAKAESSICNAYLVKKASLFYVHYFEPHVKARLQKVLRNVDIEEEIIECPRNLSIFTCPSRTLGKVEIRYLI